MYFTPICTCKKHERCKECSALWDGSYDGCEGCKSTKEPSPECIPCGWLKWEVFAMKCPYCKHIRHIQSWLKKAKYLPDWNKERPHLNDPERRLCCPGCGKTMQIKELTVTGKG